MTKEGYRILDSDTHVTPLADVLETYMDKRELERVKPFQQYRRKAMLYHGHGDSAGAPVHYEYKFNSRKYERRLGAAGSMTPTKGGQLPYQSARHRKTPNPMLEDDPAARIKDMDIEGVDVDFLLQSGPFGAWTSQPDVELESSWYRAFHRWMNDYCSRFPHRLTGVILCSARDVEGAVGEIRRWGGSPWGRAVFVYAPQSLPLDHPSLEPIWAAAAERDSAMVLHTFTSDPPYAPGGRDTWDNLWLQRSAAHPWCGMRNMAATLGSGVMDRYPQMRVGLLEAGHGWLPFWMHRLDEHAEMVKNALPPLEMKPSEYVKSGRYFQSIEISEGPAMTKLVIDLLGEDTLMYASDYPHGESWFPESTATVLDWTELNESVKTKLLWTNAARLYKL